MANNYWLGAADDIKQSDSVTVTGVWATGDIATVICNNKTVTVTVGSSVTTSDIAEILAAAIMAASDSADIVNDETRNRGGRELGEFRDIDASAAAAVLTLESATAGVPFVVTLAQTTAGSGSLGSVSNDVVATGKNHVDNAANWSGTLTTDDTTIVQDTSVSLLYGMANTVADLDLVVRNSFTGDIGLPAINSTHSGYSYPEYRQQKLDLPITVTTGQQAHVIGDQGSPVSPVGVHRFDLGTVAGSSQSLTVYSAAAISASNGSAVQLAGGKDLTLRVYQGSLSTGMDSDTATEIGSLEIGVDSGASTANVRIKENASFASGTTVKQNAGQLYLYGFSLANMTFNLHGGIATIDRGAVAIGSATAVTVYAGATLNFDGVGITTLTLYGTFDASQSVGSTVTNATFYPGFTLKDGTENITWTNGIDFVGCSPADGAFQVKPHLTWTPTAI